jgi:hypothetical protein
MVVIADMGDGLVAERLDRSSKGDCFEKARDYSARKFGVDSKAHEDVMRGIDVESVTGSNYFFNKCVDVILPEDRRVITYGDMFKIYADSRHAFLDVYSPISNDLTDTYSDTTTLVLRSVVVDSSISRNLAAIAKEAGQEFSPENPLLISGLEMEKDIDWKSPYGIVLKAGSDTSFRNDWRLASSRDGGRGVFGRVPVRYWGRDEFRDLELRVRASKEGASRVVADCVTVSTAWDDFTLAGPTGRVVIVRPK